MRGKDTIEFLGLWEQLHNPGFKHIEFDRFRKEAGYKTINGNQIFVNGTQYSGRV